MDPTARSNGTNSPPVGALRILVVDDEDLLRRALTRMLGDHLVVAVASVDEGVERLAKERFDLILCDLSMPRRTGIDMHAELQRRWPMMLRRFVVMSGGAYTPELREFMEQHPSLARLDKPLTLAAIRAVVQRVFESETRAV